MKVLYVCHQFFPEFYTGTERYTLDIAKQMQRMGHQVSVLTYTAKAAGANLSHDSGVVGATYDYEGVPVIALQHADFSRRGEWSGVSFELTDSAIFHATDRLLGESSFDLVHCVHPMRVGESVRVAKQRGLKVVLTLMDYWMLCPRGTLLRADGIVCEGPDGGKNCRMYCYDAQMAERLINRYDDAQDFLEQADVIIAHSQFLIDVFTKNSAETRFNHLPNGMDYAKFKFTKRRWEGKGVITFGFLGTVLPHKGVHILVDAFKQVPSDNIRLKIYGGYFGERGYYTSLLEAAKGDQRIEFCGTYEYNNVAEVLREIDVAVVPSVWYENAPLVISMAQGFGIPVITTGIGGMAEKVLDGVNGFTFRLGDVEGLADKIRLIAMKPGILEELSRNRIPPPRIETEVFLLETLYSALIGKGGVGGP